MYATAQTRRASKLYDGDFFDLTEEDGEEVGEVELITQVEEVESSKSAKALPPLLVSTAQDRSNVNSPQGNWAYIVTKEEYELMRQQGKISEGPIMKFVIQEPVKSQVDGAVIIVEDTQGKKCESSKVKVLENVVVSSKRSQVSLATNQNARQLLQLAVENDNKTCLNRISTTKTTDPLINSAKIVTTVDLNDIKLPPLGPFEFNNKPNVKSSEPKLFNKNSKIRPTVSSTKTTTTTETVKLNLNNIKNTQLNNVKNHQNNPKILVVDPLPEQVVGHILENFPESVTPATETTVQMSLDDDLRSSSATVFADSSEPVVLLSEPVATSVIPVDIPKTFNRRKIPPKLSSVSVLDQCSKFDKASQRERCKVIRSRKIQLDSSEKGFTYREKVKPKCVQLLANIIMEEEISIQKHKKIVWSLNSKIPQRSRPIETVFEPRSSNFCPETIDVDGKEPSLSDVIGKVMKNVSNLRDLMKASKGMKLIRQGLEIIKELSDKTPGPSRINKIVNTTEPEIIKKKRGRPFKKLKVIQDDAVPEAPKRRRVDPFKAPNEQDNELFVIKKIDILNGNHKVIATSYNEAGAAVRPFIENRKRRPKIKLNL